MSLFDSLGQRSSAANPQTQQQALTEIKADPSGFLKRAGYNVPAGMTDPRQIMSHLIQTGQVQNGRLQMLQQMMGRK